MKAEDSPEQLSIDIYNSDSNSLSDNQCPSPKVMFEDEVAEEKNGGKNRRSKFKTQFIPSVSVSEKIIICIDTSPDIALGYKCSTSNQTAVETSTIMKEALRVFFTNKLAIAKDTKFALVSVRPGYVEQISNFTSDINRLVKSLSELKSGTNEEGKTDYDVTKIFSNVFSSFPSPETLKTKMVPPEFVVRVIFIYNNSHSIPRFNESDNSYRKFLNSPYYILDILHLHEAQSDYNSVEKIYGEFGKMVSSHSYLLECSRNVTQVFNVFAKLLAHPYQRVSQGMWEI